MTSKVQDNTKKRNGNQEALRINLPWLGCFGTAGENCKKFHMFNEDGIFSRTTALKQEVQELKYNSMDDNCYLKKIC